MITIYANSIFLCTPIFTIGPKVFNVTNSDIFCGGWVKH